MFTQKVTVGTKNKNGSWYLDTFMCQGQLEKLEYSNWLRVIIYYNKNQFCLNKFIEK